MSTGLSDFHNMIITACKTTFPKAKPKLLVYRDYSKFIEHNFHCDVKENVHNLKVINYESAEKVLLDVPNKHTPYKKKVIRAHRKPYVI